MIREKQMELIQTMDKALIDVLISKSKDYATEDVLSNFKRLSAAAKALNINIQTAEGYALFMTLMKLDRINNLITANKIPSNESIEDSFGDGVNYLKLAYCCFKDKKDEIISSKG
jgi:hypothetical protein